MTGPFTPSVGVAAAAPKTDADIARVWYDPTLTYQSSLKEDVNRLRDEAGVSEADASAHLDGMAEAFADGGLVPDQAARVHSLIVGRTLKPVDEATLHAEQTASRRYLRERYSEAEATRRIGIMKQYLEAHPTLKNALAASGAGSHPDVIRALDERLHQLQTTPHPRAVKRAARTK